MYFLTHAYIVDEQNEPVSETPIPLRVIYLKSRSRSIADGAIVVVPPPQPFNYEHDDYRARSYLSRITDAISSIFGGDPTLSAVKKKKSKKSRKSKKLKKSTRKRK